MLEILGPHHDRNGIEYGIGIAMVSAGRELFFFLVASTVLFFGFRMRIMLITH